MKLSLFFQSKKVLVTGHTGFKGAWLTQILTSWGADVIGISLEPNTTPNLFNILSLADRTTHKILDIRNFEEVKKVFESSQPDIVFHLAAQPLVRESYDDPLYTYSTNVMGTVNILECIRQTPSVKSSVIITTDKVYKNNEWLYPYREVDPLGGFDPYSSSKAAADIAAQSYIQSFFSSGSSLVAIARAGNVIGGGDWSKDRLVPDIIRAIYETEENVKLRNPRSVRPWEHVLEPLSGYLLLAQKLYGGEKKYSGAWNFGPNEESFVTTQKMTELAIKIVKKGRYEIQKDATKHEANLLKLDINKARTLLDWRPQINLEESLLLTFKWYEAFYSQSIDMSDLTNQQITSFFDTSRIHE